MHRQAAIWQGLCIPGVLSGMFFLGGCVSYATAWAEKVTLQDVKMPTECSGWEKLEVRSRSRYYLMREDQRLLVNIDAHNLRGRNLGCWK